MIFLSCTDCSSTYSHNLSMKQVGSESSAPRPIKVNVGVNTNFHTKSLVIKHCNILQH